jgi:hypothetical protein
MVRMKTAARAVPPRVPQPGAVAERLGVPMRAPTL